MGQFIRRILALYELFFISHQTLLRGFVLEGDLPSFMNRHVLEVSLNERTQLLWTHWVSQDFLSALEENIHGQEIRKLHGLQKGVLRSSKN